MWELSLSACWGVRNRPPRKKKFANPRGCGGGGGGKHSYKVKLNHAILKKKK